jgi:Ca-activated chloride channel family protein
MSKPFSHLFSSAVSLFLAAGTCFSQPVGTPPERDWVVPGVGMHRRVSAPASHEPVRLTDVHADVEIVDQIATTTLELTLHNPGARPQEAVLALPVPDGVSIRAVQYDGVGPEPTATLIARDDARKIYAEIVRSMRDPALVEFIGLNMIQTSVFPIPAGGTQKLRLTMEQVLLSEGDRVDYTLLRSNSLADSSVPWTLSIDIRSKLPIVSVFSPSHTLDTSMPSTGHAKVKIAGNGAQNGSIRLSYLNARNNTHEPVFSVFAFPDPSVANGAPGGYFMLLGALPEVSAAAPRKREVVLVIDRSGSMRGPKMDQARAAALQVVEGLLEGEAFNIIDYSDSIRSMSPAPVIKTAETLKTAREYISQLKADGGTNIRDAVLEALKSTPYPDMLPMTLFITDGMPTVGERRESVIRSEVAAANKLGRRIFTFGVGLDVNTPLLSSLAAQTRATSTFVLPDENLEMQVSHVFKGLAGPVLEAPSLAAMGGKIREPQPAVLPDYFEGDQIVVFGEYVGDKPFVLQLKGIIRGQPFQNVIRFDTSSASTRHDYVPRLWATRRIAQLIEQVRSDGADGSKPPSKEITDEIVHLSTKFGVLTEYTAFLAKETTNFNTPALDTLRAEVGASLEKRAVSGRTGAGAVNQESNLRSMTDSGFADARRMAPNAAMPPAAAAMPAQAKSKQSYLDENLQKVEINTIRQIGNRAFYNRQNRWVDSTLLEDESKTPDRTIIFGSAEYLELAETLAKSGEQALLAQEGDILLSVGGKRVLVKSASE